MNDAVNDAVNAAVTGGVARLPFARLLLPFAKLLLPFATLPIAAAEVVATTAPPPAVSAKAIPAAAETVASVLIVVGAAGTPAYAARFRETAARWEKSASRAQAKVTSIGRGDSDKSASADKAALQSALRAAGREHGPLWIVLIGHGTHDGRTARFNLRGSDVSAAELQAWCKPLARPLVVVNGASSSGPFLPALSGPQRILVTATRSGGESSAPRFGAAFAEAIADPRADLDRDGGTSVLEAFLHASKKVEASFAEEGLLASEHPLLDDNGDGLGTSPDFFRGLVGSARATTDAPRDGARAGQVTLVPAPAERAMPPALRPQRDELERAVLTLREQRSKLSETVYFSRLERLLLKLARIYQQAD